ncbi:MAG: hypothetical protein GY851_19380 [bacterium]|nr:hypothetical protein [bacterium]
MTADTSHRDKAFGWQGLSARIPSDWDLGAFGGDSREGHAFLDDGVAVRLRVRWTKGRGGNPQAGLKRYRRAIAKSKSLPGLSEAPEEFLPPRFRRDKVVYPFRWEGGCGAAWRCAACGRLVTAEVTPGIDDPDAKLSRRILATVACHPDGDEALWAVYGFAFRLPSTYNLAQAGLEAGRLVFPFRRSDKDWLTVERWAVASQLLAKAPLGKCPGEWLKLGGWSVGDVVCRTEEVQDAPGVRFEAQARRRSGWLRGLTRLEHVAGLLWHDAEADKLVVLAAGDPAEGLLDAVATSVECC